MSTDSADNDPCLRNSGVMSFTLEQPKQRMRPGGGDCPGQFKAALGSLLAAGRTDRAYVFSLASGSAIFHTLMPVVEKKNEKEKSKKKVKLIQS